MEETVRNLQRQNEKLSDSLTKGDDPKLMVWFRLYELIKKPEPRAHFPCFQYVLKDRDSYKEMNKTQWKELKELRAKVGELTEKTKTVAQLESSLKKLEQENEDLQAQVQRKKEIER